jgi:hypothetical protein
MGYYGLNARYGKMKVFRELNSEWLTADYIFKK